MRTLPAGWRADISIAAATGEPITVAPLGSNSAVAPKHLSDQDSTAFTLCDDVESNLGLRVAPTSKAGPGAVRLIVDAKLRLEACK
jgi:hypothetical protein